MIDVTLIFVPPGGGEADYQMPFTLPAVPHVGDYIFIDRTGIEKADDNLGYESFLVRRIRWELDFPDDGKTSHAKGQGPRGTVKEIWVECEFADCGLASKRHKRSVEMYRNRGKGHIELEESAY